MTVELVDDALDRSGDLESWQRVFRFGFAPSLPTLGLEALRKALVEEDERLIRETTSLPPPLQCTKDWPVEGACAIGYCGWQSGEGLSTVAEVEEFFARTCYEADERLGEPAGCRWFLNWFDEAPISEVREKLIPEIDLELLRRQQP